MKKLFLLLTISVLMTLGQTHSQTLDDYISEVKGDTLVIKDYHDMGNKPNSLYVLLLDTINAPAGRVYELKQNGYYPHYNNPEIIRSTVIVGENPVSVVNNNNMTLKPPLICAAPGEYDPYVPSISLKADFTIKNCQLVNAAADQGIGWSLFLQTKPGIRMLFDNCIMERTWWVMVALKDYNCTVKFKNCYFVNLSGRPFWRNSGVMSSLDKQDTLLVENCTHIMTQGMVYEFGNVPFNRIIFNHNTFINSAGPENFVHPDWPIPVDLSYSDADLQTAGLGGFPLGDLNWFAAEKELWLAQRSAEYDSIDKALNSGRLVTSIKEQNRLPVGFELQQNYPNPFNPNTTITFTIPKTGHVSLKVYNMLGQQVAILIDDLMTPQTYKIQFDGRRLASGVYLYRLESRNNIISKKMILIK